MENKDKAKSLKESLYVWTDYLQKYYFAALAFMVAMGIFASSKGIHGLRMSFGVYLILSGVVVGLAILHAYMYYERESVKHEKHFSKVAKFEKILGLVIGISILATMVGAFLMVPAFSQRTCSDFENRQAAESFFKDKGGSRDKNVGGLDGDRDGRPCEGLTR